MKKWLSRGIVLAMIVAMMVPAPVLAKSSSKGGKLVKSVTHYDFNEDANRWQMDWKTAYTYDKKGNPVEFAEYSYGRYFLGVPTRGRKTITTAKYKYKGKTVKSAKMKDGAGNVTETRKYKKGRVVSGSSVYKESNYDAEKKVETAEITNSTWTVAYNKKGLATAGAYGSVTTKSDGTAPYAVNGTVTYAIAQSKGIPSLITRTEGASNYGPATYPAETTPSAYTKFNSKGLAVETGTIENGVYVPDTMYVYTSKKGKVTTATVYRVYANEKTGAVEKTTPVGLYKFKYTKKKASAVRYLSMINALIGFDNGYLSNAFFAWY